MPRNTLTWKKNIWKFNCGTSRPFQKGSDYKILRNLDVCIFISKKELWKNRAPARRSCLLAHDEPFFHFNNSVDDHTLIFSDKFGGFLTHTGTHTLKAMDVLVQLGIPPWPMTCFFSPDLFEENL